MGIIEPRFTFKAEVVGNVSLMLPLEIDKVVILTRMSHKAILSGQINLNSKMFGKLKILRDIGKLKNEVFGYPCVPLNCHHQRHYYGTYYSCRNNSGHVLI